ncbi:MAG: hypothetical protein H6818_07620 [Phycisphaerales bacterium]|nr:hypothetical protein [Phycisphaerales bacterium]MCB9864193.1 hypothetical protein [Phycisphaerales bacterium]
MADRTESIGSTIRTGAVVVVITLLIWIVADQWVTTEEEFSITILPNSAHSDRYVAFSEPPYHRTINIKVRGRRSRIETFRSRYESPEGEVIRIPIDDLRPASIDPQGLPTAKDVLRQVPDLRQVGIIVDADPPMLNVRIDRFVEVADIPVRFDYGEVRVRDKPATRKVTARLPEFAAKDERFQADRHAVVHASSLIENQTPGSSFDFVGDVTLEHPIDLPSDAVQLTPDKIRVRGQVETLETTKNKGPITVKWSIPDSVQRKYAVIAESGEFVGLHIDVRGPKDRVAQLDASKIRAFVEILAADIDSAERGDIIVRDVVFLLPPEFCDCSLLETSEPRQVRFRLVPRGVAAGTIDDTDGVGP